MRDGCVHKVMNDADREPAVIAAFDRHRLRMGREPNVRVADRVASVQNRMGFPLASPSRVAAAPTLDRLVAGRSWMLF